MGAVTYSFSRWCTTLSFYVLRLPLQQCPVRQPPEPPGLHQPRLHRPSRNQQRESPRFGPPTLGRTPPATLAWSSPLYSCPWTRLKARSTILSSAKQLVKKPKNASTGIFTFPRGQEDASVSWCSWCPKKRENTTLPRWITQEDSKREWKKSSRHDNPLTTTANLEPDSDKMIQYEPTKCILKIGCFVSPTSFPPLYHPYQLYPSHRLHCIQQKDINIYFTIDRELHR